METVTLVLPAFNEERNIAVTVEFACQALAALAREWEIIIVNDGSADGTGEICDQLTSSNRRVRVVHHATNRGYGAALKSGIVLAQHDLIFFTDSDGQFSFKELPVFIEHAKQYDIVAGYRGKRHDPFHRVVNATGWKILVRMLLGIRIRDIDCAYKVFRREVFTRIQIRSVGAMVNTEILAQAMKFCLRLKEVEVTHFPRRFGKPTGANIRVIFKAFGELFKLWWKLKYIHPDQQGLFAEARGQSGSIIATDPRPEGAQNFDLK